MLYRLLALPPAAFCVCVVSVCSSTKQVRWYKLNKGNNRPDRIFPFIIKSNARYCMNVKMFTGEMYQHHYTKENRVVSCSTNIELYHLHSSTTNTMMLAVLIESGWNHTDNPTWSTHNHINANTEEKMTVLIQHSFTFQQTDSNLRALPQYKIFPLRGPTIHNLLSSLAAARRENLAKTPHMTWYALSRTHTLTSHYLYTHSQCVTGNTLIPALCKHSALYNSADALTNITLLLYAICLGNTRILTRTWDQTVEKSVGDDCNAAKTRWTILTRRQS